MTFFFETASEKEKRSPQGYILDNSFLHEHSPRVENIAKAPGGRIYPRILIDIESLEDLISLIKKSDYPIVVTGESSRKDYYPTITLYDDYLE